MGHQSDAGELMDRAALEHIIRAAGNVLGEQSVIIIGSQAILASFDENRLPVDAMRSMEADVLPLDDPDGSKADLIDGVLGELSQFDETFGYHGDGVSVETAVLPVGWESRLIPYENENTNGVTGLCLDRHDLCVAKLAAHREKDLTFVASLYRAHLIDISIILRRLNQTSLPDELRGRIGSFLSQFARG